ncbi:MAG: hypothetical protein IPL71_05415 [Anaerolineales bacterium]|uniref:hypothetical protein n=1 Tax=Candidatus Villigracilis proximus TaxID=3140683 RepID=UPI0031349A20|nr:hypothetical protein [Anaerolineales bacterium]
MYRIFAILISLSLTLSACGSSPSIWGIPQTPTADLLNSNTIPFDPFAVQDNPIIFPTSTTPPLIETEAAYTPHPPPMELPRLSRPHSHHHMILLHSSITPKAETCYQLWQPVSAWKNRKSRQMLI